MKVSCKAILLFLLGWALAACTTQPSASTASQGGAQPSQSVSAGEPKRAGTGTVESPSGGPPDSATHQPSPITAPRQRTPLVVFCAGSLILPFDDLEQAFEAAHPDIDVLNECHGSIQVIRHVTELHEAIDVVATADHALIPMLMYQNTNPDSGLPYALWYVRFATNRLALAFTERSREAAEINPQNWYKLITRPGVKLGIADPRFDASGYRALMALKLAEDFYGDPNIFESMIKGSFRYPITIFQKRAFRKLLCQRLSSRFPIRGS